jgi:WD40 repeat protein
MLRKARKCRCANASIYPTGKYQLSELFGQCFVGHGGAVLCGQFTPDGKLLVSGAEDGTVRVWGPKSGVSKVSITMSDSPVTCLDVSADSTLVLGGCADGTVSLVQVESGKLLGKYEGHTDGIEGVAFCSSFPFVASASLDGTVKVWDTGRHEVRHTLTHQVWARQWLVVDWCCGREPWSRFSGIQLCRGYILPQWMAL